MNVTTDHFLTILQLSKVLTSWDMTPVGTVGKNKNVIPINMQHNKNGVIYKFCLQLVSYRMSTTKKNRYYWLLQCDRQSWTWCTEWNNMERYCVGNPLVRPGSLYIKNTSHKWRQWMSIGMFDLAWNVWILH